MPSSFSPKSPSHERDRMSTLHLLVTLVCDGPSYWIALIYEAKSEEDLHDVLVLDGGASVSVILDQPGRSFPLLLK